MTNRSSPPSASKRRTPPSEESTREAAVDAELVRRFTTGEDAAFLSIMERYQARIFSTVLALLHNHADAEEITQDTFIRAHRNLHRFRGDSSLATWLYRIAVNLARNRYWYFFRRRRQDSLSLNQTLGEDNEGTLSDLLAAPAADPARESATAEFTALVADGMARLDTRHREILTMRNVLDLSYNEIARTLRINVGTVKSRIARARESLRRLIAESCPEFAPGAPASDYFIPDRRVYGRPAMAFA